MYCPTTKLRATGRLGPLPRGSDRLSVIYTEAAMLMEEMRTAVRRELLRAVEPMRWLPIFSRPPP
jgi:hypothetical protein